MGAKNSLETSILLTFLPAVMIFLSMSLLYVLAMFSHPATIAGCKRIKAALDALAPDAVLECEHMVSGIRVINEIEYDKLHDTEESRYLYMMNPVSTLWWRRGLRTAGAISQRAQLETNARALVFTFAYIPLIGASMALACAMSWLWLFATFFLAASLRNDKKFFMHIGLLSKAKESYIFMFIGFVLVTFLHKFAVFPAPLMYAAEIMMFLRSARLAGLNHYMGSHPPHLRDFYDQMLGEQQA
jgi:hypothetical protein